MVQFRKRATPKWCGATGSAGGFSRTSTGFFGVRVQPDQIFSGILEVWLLFFQKFPGKNVSNWQNLAKPGKTWQKPNPPQSNPWNAEVQRADRGSLPCPTEPKKRYESFLKRCLIVFLKDFFVACLLNYGDVSPKVFLINY